MKPGIILFLFFYIPVLLAGQKVVPSDTTKHIAKQDTINPNKGNIKTQLKEIKAEKIKQHSDSIKPDSIGNQPKKSTKIDTVVQDKYGDLLKDDSAYNKKYSLCIPFVEGVGDNAALSLVDSKILNYGWAQVGMTSWKRNLSAGPPWGPGWVWDQTRFGNDFLGHPIFGNFYYNDARANGYNFWASAPFALIGSYEWKIFGENIPPEKNSLIATTVDGILLGEILYRISSNILDDRTYGTERTFREILAAIVDPMRGFNRLIQGKTSRHTNKEIYQKEPINITFYGGIHKINDHTNAILSGPTSEILNIQFDYGNPFEVRYRAPFDFFKLRIESDIGVGRKIIDNITGYGILSGKNVQAGKLSLLEGILLYYDYWDKPIFELSTIAIGGGVFSKLPLGKTSFLYTNVHLGIVPFAGASSEPISDTSQYRDFNFGYGGEAKLETSLIMGNIATVGVNYYYFIIHSINSVGVDEPGIASLGTNFMGILEPRITFRIYKNLNIGGEYYYYAQTHTDGYTTLTYHSEQEIFLEFYFEDPQRRGHFNL
jgi:Domain of unknown function (DUF3943)